MTWLNDNLSTLLEKLEELQSSGLCHVYIFGSSTRKDDPKDIDLLIVNKENLTPEKEAKLQELYGNLNIDNINGIPFHILRMTYNEYHTHTGPVFDNIKKTALILF